MKILFIIFCLLILSVCDDKIDERLKKFAFDIIEHPEKLRDLKKFYHDFVDEKYTHTLVTDSNYVERHIKALKMDLQKGASNIYINKVGITALIRDLENKDIISI